MQCDTQKHRPKYVLVKFSILKSEMKDEKYFFKIRENKLTWFRP